MPIAWVAATARAPIVAGWSTTTNKVTGGPEVLVEGVGGGTRGQVGQAQPHVGTNEDALLGVLEEVGEGTPRLHAHECEVGGEVADDGAADVFGLEAGR